MVYSEGHLHIGMPCKNHQGYPVAFKFFNKAGGKLLGTLHAVRFYILRIHGTAYIHCHHQINSLAFYIFDFTTHFWIGQSYQNTNCRQDNENQLEDMLGIGFVR